MIPVCFISPLAEHIIGACPFRDPSAVCLVITINLGGMLSVTPVCTGGWKPAAPGWGRLTGPGIAPVNVSKACGAA